MALKLIVGLGNPEPRYDMTRHNAGFQLIDALATKSGASLANSKNMQAHIAKIKYLGQDVILAKPMTYMNLSGQAVAAIMNFYKIERQNLIVSHDEVALNLGIIRLAKGGGSAGNHGIESIIACLGYNDFNRLRIGIGPDPGGAVRAHYVLSVFPPDEQDHLNKVIDVCIQSIDEWMRNGILDAMNKFNGRPVLTGKEPPPAPPAKKALDTTRADIKDSATPDSL